MLAPFSTLYLLDDVLAPGLHFGISTLRPSCLEFESLADVRGRHGLVLHVLEEWILMMLDGLVLGDLEVSFPKLPSPIALNAA